MNRWFWLFCCLLGFFPREAPAEEGVIPGNQVLVSTEEMYRRWAKHRPEEVIAQGRKAVQYIQNNGESVFSEFNEPSKEEWWSDRPYFTPVMVMRCDEMRNVTHPVAQFYKILTQKGTVSKFVDVRGEHTFLELCQKLIRKSEPVWVKQYHYWPGTKEPVWMAVLGMPVPGTFYQIHLFYLTPEPDLERLNQLLLTNP